MWDRTAAGWIRCNLRPETVAWTPSRTAAPRIRPRLKRELGNAVVRDLLFTGRTLNATRAHAVGLVAQLAGEGESLRIARSTAAQVAKYDPVARAAAKEFMKPIPHEELRCEIEIFCELFTLREVMAALKKFVEDSGPMPYLP